MFNKKFAAIVLVMGLIALIGLVISQDKYTEDFATKEQDQAGWDQSSGYVEPKLPSTGVVLGQDGSAPQEIQNTALIPAEKVSQIQDQEVLPIQKISKDVSISISEQNRTSRNSQNINLSGIWGSNDYGYYYIQQYGNIVWLYGSLDECSDLPVYRLVAYGNLNNDTASLSWMNLPTYTRFGYEPQEPVKSGTIELRIVSNNELRKIREVGSIFEPYTWHRRPAL